jgi:hypothetical protein
MSALEPYDWPPLAEAEQFETPWPGFKVFDHSAAMAELHRWFEQQEQNRRAVAWWHAAQPKDPQ